MTRSIRDFVVDSVTAVAKLEAALLEVFKEEWALASTSAACGVVEAVLLPSGCHLNYSIDEVEDIRRLTGADTLLIETVDGHVAFRCIWEIKS
jgi:hypothetical protein